MREKRDERMRVGWIKTAAICTWLHTKTFKFSSFKFSQPNPLYKFDFASLGLCIALVFEKSSKWNNSFSDHGWDPYMVTITFTAYFFLFKCPSFYLQVGTFVHGSRINSKKSLENFPTGIKKLSQFSQPNFYLTSFPYLQHPFLYNFIYIIVKFSITWVQQQHY